MTIEQILNCPNVEELEKLTDKEILEIYKDYLKFTRPELVEKPSVNKPKTLHERAATFGMNAKKQKAMEMARQLGIDLDL